MKFNSLVKTLPENRLTYKGHDIVISESNVYVDSELILEDCISEGAGKLYAKNYIDSLVIIEDISVVSKESIINSIIRHHNIKVTNTLVEAYEEIIESGQFTLDPVVLELKEGKSSFVNKVEFKLNDGTVVAIDESTRDKLMSLNVDKYKLVDFMNKSKENFVAVIQELGR